ncbi:hypothetical protein Y032_0247g62 [Ancylostoma ceylanicum]|uniref:Uncharacterized protein n=1 Tax=Ancylostoma ceylanicum TaxID=53326 RepID=A0A016SDL6_9BILA|nr:hypothetical protein Y032_0247g62 [Ancylostoma ceylanicum]
MTTSSDIREGGMQVEMGPPPVVPGSGAKIVWHPPPTIERRSPRVLNDSLLCLSTSSTGIENVINFSHVDYRPYAKMRP